MSETFETIAWDAMSDAVVLEYGPEMMPKFLKLITPQSFLIDNMASKAVEVIEKLDDLNRVHHPKVYPITK